MANKIKKISATAFTKATNDNYSPTITVEWNGLNIVIKRNLNISEMAAFVDGVVTACFSDKNDGFTPEFKEFVIDAIMVELYTNIDMPGDLSDRYDVIYRSGITQLIMENIDTWQYEDIRSAIEAKIKNINDANISSFNKQVSELYHAVENIESQMSSVFEGINANDIKNIAGAISGGKIDEEKLVKAYVKETRMTDGKN